MVKVEQPLSSVHWLFMQVAMVWRYFVAGRGGVQAAELSSAVSLDVSEMSSIPNTPRENNIRL